MTRKSPLSTELTVTLTTNEPALCGGMGACHCTHPIADPAEDLGNRKTKDPTASFVGLDTQTHR